MNWPRLSLIGLLLLGFGAYWAYQERDRLGWFQPPEEKYLIRDFHSLIIVPDDTGGCKEAIGYEQKHLIGDFTAIPVKRVTCRDYFFAERPEAKFKGAELVLVKIQNGEYHWILDSQLKFKL